MANQSTVPRSDAWSIWAHFSWLTLLACALEVGVGASSAVADGVLIWSGVVTAAAALAGFLFGVLPVIAGISCALALGADDRGSGRRAALTMATWTALGMAALDVAHSPSGSAVVVGPAEQDGEVVQGRLALDFGAVSAGRTAIEALRGELTQVRERLPVYPNTHSRVVASTAIMKAGTLLSPFLIVAIVVGLLTWMNSRIVFRSAADERVARLMIAWVMSPGIYLFLGLWADRARAGALFGYGTLGSILFPYVPLGAIAVVAWSRTRVRAPDPAEPSQVT